ncbi:MAG: polysaccharide pyruvyl transferase family protein [Ruminococcus sp.]
MGVDDTELLKTLEPQYRDSLKCFDNISVREKYLVDYFSKLTDKTIYNCIDPTFLRTKSDYDSLIENYKQDNGNRKEFIYVYLLGKNLEAYEYANKIAKKYNLDIYCHVSNISLLEGNIFSTIDDGPLEFLCRIRDSKFVITDSFHGTALSIIYQKQFFTFTRGTMSIRLENLLSTIDAKDRLVEHISDQTDISQSIDYSKINANINKWINYSRNYLKEALGVEN